VKPAASELPRRKNVVLQQMEHDDMASEHHGDRQAADQRKQPSDPRSPAPPLPQGGPPLLNEGLEVPRSSHC
jgi:hypothetical protein